jgi:hypothetical protein
VVTSLIKENEMLSIASRDKVSTKRSVAAAAPVNVGQINRIASCFHERVNQSKRLFEVVWRERNGA